MLVRKYSGCLLGRGRRLAFGGLVAICALLSALQAAHAAPKTLSVETWTLDNGLKVVFAARQGAPLVSVQVLYHVGSRHEEAGEYGLARVTRELMFRGSQNVPPGMHTRLVARVGGRASSIGDEDVTILQNTIPSPYLDFVLSLEADRMRGLAFFDATFAEVKQAVLALRQRQVEQNAVGKVVDLLRAEAFGDHPYGRSVAGVEEDLRKLTVADCQRFYDRHYVPNNATLVIAGAASAAQVRRLVEEHFGSMEPGEKAAPPSVPPLQVAGRVRSLRLPIELPLVAVGAPLPRLDPEERAAMLVLAEALAGGSAGIVSRNIVGPSSPAVAAGGAPALWQDGGLFVLFAVHRTQRPQEEVRRALLDQLAAVRERPLPPPILAQARLRAAEAIATRLSTAAGLAEELGRAAVSEGSAETALLRPELLLAVTDTEVGRVANKYFAEDRLSVLLLSPAPPVRKPSERAR